MAPRFLGGSGANLDTGDPADLQFVFPRTDQLHPPSPPASFTPANLDLTVTQAVKLWPDTKKQSCINALESQFADGDPSKAIVLLQFYRDAVQGYVTSACKRNGSFLPLRGAMNYAGISCYIDSLLVAMYSRMENFEPLLYKQKYEDKATERLAVWLRLFVNLLRNGERITEDIMEALLAAAVGAGWTANTPPLIQQDAAEFFVFITEKLKMPLLALKVDIAHAGKEAADVDHKLIREQLLYLPVPGSEEDPPIPLEECLEIYFSNTVQVSRHLSQPGPWASTEPLPGRRRSYSIMSVTSPSTHQIRRFSGQPWSLADDDVLSTPSPPQLPALPGSSDELSPSRTPVSATTDAPFVLEASGASTPETPRETPRFRQPHPTVLRNSGGAQDSYDPLDESASAISGASRGPTLSDRSQADPSGAQTVARSGSTTSAWTGGVRNSSVSGTLPGSLPSYHQLFGFNDDSQADARVRDMKQSLWTSDNEVTLPAWMFLQLMPFYADTTDPKGEPLENLEADEVAHHFAKKRPVLGFCLKRYYVDHEGHPRRNNRIVTVPETISLPSFVADDSDHKQAFGNFKLVLESAVFHRGNSIHSGHYCSLIAEDPTRPRKPSAPTTSTNEWKRFSWLGKGKRESQSVDMASSTSSLMSDASGDAQPSMIVTSSETGKKWLFFDDLEPSGERIKEVDYQTIFERESPYLLFYRMVALNESPHRNLLAPPKSQSQATSKSSTIPAAQTTAVPSQFTGPQVWPVVQGSDQQLGPIPQPISPPRPVSKLAPPFSEQSHSRPASRPSSQPPTRPTSPVPEGAVKDKKKKSKFFRRHKDKDKDYASKYREEKCILM